MCPTEPSVPMDGVVGIVIKTAIGPFEIAGTAGNGDWPSEDFLSARPILLRLLLWLRSQPYASLSNPRRLYRVDLQKIPLPLRAGLEGGGAVRPRRGHRLAEIHQNSHDRAADRRAPWSGPRWGGRTASWRKAGRPRQRDCPLGKSCSMLEAGYKIATPTSKPLM